MQYNDDKSLKSTTRPRLARTRFVGMDSAGQTTGPLPDTGDLSADRVANIADQPTTAFNKSQMLGISKDVRQHLPAFLLKNNWRGPAADQCTAHLLQLSGMIRPVRTTGAITGVLGTPIAASIAEDGYWPLGIQQVGPLPIRNLYGHEPLGRTLPQAVALVMPENEQEAQPGWQKTLASPAYKIVLGGLIGMGLLFLVSRFVDLARTLQIIGTHLGTPQGIALALLAGIAYLTGHGLRGIRWQLFLKPICKVNTLKVFELYQVATFLNFLLPIRTGEGVKSLVLKRIANVPVSKSLPTVAMDKALDLVPALVIMILIPFFGIHMDLRLWLLLGLVGCVLVALLLFIGLAIWKRAFAINLLQKILGWLPSVLGGKIEGFATGFVDALLAGASRPAIFLPALGLTCGAVLCDGLFAMLAFRTIGLPISFGIALAGYTLYNMFCILPTPPGLIGLSEVVYLLVFAGLLHLPGESVIAMAIFSHLWIALILTIFGTACVAALGLTINSAIRTPGAERRTQTP